ncbi:MAG: hypothetical protein ACE5ID_09935 [Acidobacteriota bacterium]
MRISLEQFLKTEGGITDVQIRDARRTQQFFGGSILSNLVRLDVIPEFTAEDLFAAWTGYPVPVQEELQVIPAAIIRLIPADIALRRQVLPFRRDEKVLYVATARADNEPFFRELEHHLGLKVIPRAVLEKRLLSLLERSHGQPREGLSSGGPVPVLEQLAAASGRQAIGRAAVALGLSRGLSRLLLLGKQKDCLIAWEAGGIGVRNESLPALRLTLQAPSIFASLLLSRSPYMGPVPDLPVHRGLLDVLEGSAPVSAAMVPVVLRQRTVAAIYADGGPDSGESPEPRVLGTVSVKTALALEILILRRKILA